MTIYKDITKIDFGIIVHQVSCYGDMNDSLSLRIRDKWPEVYQSFLSKKEKYIGARDFLLGEIAISEINDSLFVVSLFGQLEETEEGSTARHTSYCAWEKALKELDRVMIFKSLPSKIYFPHDVGSGVAGGDMRIITAMIWEYFPHAIYCKE